MPESNNQSPQQLVQLHEHFLAIVPRIKLHGTIYFRDVKSAEKKEDFIQEMIGLSWAWFRRLAERGKDGRLFPTAIATFAARAVRSGRRVCGQERSRDVLSPLARQRHNFAVNSLPVYSTLNGNPLEEALTDNTQTPVDEQVAFRLDFPAWLSTWDERRRHMITDMAQGEKTQDLAEKYKVSEGRISQMRREFHTDWRRFTGELPKRKGPAVPAQA